MHRLLSFRGTMLFLAMVMLCGCGDGRPKRVLVSGRVTIDGKPLETGVIRFIPSEGRPAIGKIGAGGRFILGTFSEDDGCVAGKHKVAVIANKPINDRAIQWFAPKKYIQAETSGLPEVEVANPRDDVEIQLTWAGGRPFVERIEPESFGK